MTPRAQHTDRTECETIDCAERAKRTMLNVNERIGGRFDAFSGRLSMVIRDVLVLASRGANEAELRLIPLAITNAIEDVFHPLTHEAERLARRLESEADRKEYAIQDMCGIEGETPAMWDEHARALRADAAASLQLARVLDEKSRKARQAQAVARQRFGLEVGS